MSYSISLSLKGISPHYSHDYLSNILEANLKCYFDWALLNIGAWTDVNIPTSGIYGGDFSRLRPVSDPNYTDGQVWESPRKDWVWETNINYVNTTGGISNPQRNSQVLVNNVSNTGYYVNYPMGQIIFNNPISTNSIVKANYSYRSVQIYKADDAPWWSEVQNNSFRPDNSHFLQSTSGEWSIFAQNRVQLPAVVIEIVPRGGSYGYSLGSDTQYAKRDVVFGIITEDKWSRKQLIDIFSLQSDRKFWIFDNNLINLNNLYPLDYKGSIVNDLNYENFVSETGFRYEILELKESLISEIKTNHPNLFIAKISTNMEILV